MRKALQVVVCRRSARAGRGAEGLGVRAGPLRAGRLTQLRQRIGGGPLHDDPLPRQRRVGALWAGRLHDRLRQCLRGRLARCARLRQCLRQLRLPLAGPDRRPLNVRVHARNTRRVPVGLWAAHVAVRVVVGLRVAATLAGAPLPRRGIPAAAGTHLPAQRLRVTARSCSDSDQACTQVRRRPHAPSAAARMRTR